MLAQCTHCATIRCNGGHQEEEQQSHEGDQYHQADGNSWYVSFFPEELQGASLRGQRSSDCIDNPPER